ncbi:MAG: putative bifunctional diguanylate cyclase/phosphodiesterase [Henriciella sp.]
MFKLHLDKDPGQLWKRYSIALVIVLAFLSASHFIEVQAIAKAKQDAAVINLSATQRVLSQRIVLYAEDYALGGNQDAVEALTNTVNEFETTHISLMDDAAKEASLGSLYLSRTPSTDEVVRNFISIARAIPDSAYPRALLDELKTKGSGEVLERLDEAVIAFETRVQSQAQWAQQLQQITLFLAVVVVLLEALFIFLPAHRLVQKTLVELRANAETDALTRLRNRAGFDRDIETAMSDRPQKDSALTLILFDLDDFKGINDRHGHMTGDAVLKRIGHRVSHLRNILSAGRVGGDEFAILVDSAQWNADAKLADIAADITEARDMIYRPINYQGRVIHVSGSVGVSRYPVDAGSLADLRRNASASLRDAKNSGRGSLSVYNKRIDEAVLRRRTIQSALLSREYQAGLSVHFQPIVETETLNIKSVEALARWHHETLGWVNPMEFLTIARECGLGQEIETALRSIALHEMGPALRQGWIESISLNVSPVELGADEFAENLLKQIAEYNIPFHQIWVEITESERMSSMAMAHKNLQTLCLAGVRIALDDYGIGYSNIHRLAKLPIHRVKVDKSIIAHVGDDKKYAGVFSSSVQLARALGAEVVAEGVETQDQLAEVERYGCKYVQGYYHYKPMPAETCLEILSARDASVA